MSDNPVALIEEEIPCMLVPMGNYFLLLPTVTVAEMAPINPLREIAETPDWFLGFYDWRHLRVPVLSYEVLNGEAKNAPNDRGRIAVINNTGIDTGIPFIALQTQGIPRMARVGPKDIEENTSVTKKPFDLMAVTVGMESFVIPDISAMEEVYARLSLQI